MKKRSEEEKEEEEEEEAPLSGDESACVYAGLHARVMLEWPWQFLIW